MASKIYNINTDNSVADPVSLPSTGISFNGNARTLAFQGTFNSTINIEASYDGGSNYIQLTDSDGSALNITTETIINISVGVGVKLRFVRSAGSGVTDIDVYAA